MPRRSILDEQDATEIDLSSMIDCIFILLIFFIVTTVFVEERGLPVNKPDAAATTQIKDSESVVLMITADNKILYDGTEIGMADVASRVKAAIHSPDTPVVIRAHEKAHHGTFVGVWDGAKRGGAEMLSFTTVN
jgi:biopolymer transport protein ExbD